MPQDDSSWFDWYEQLRGRVESRLRTCLTDPQIPDPLRQAARYSLLAEGKRLRPVLVLMAADVCGASVDSALPAACAVEMIHTYSLIHDDLPAMDDDSLRRGRPTSHVVYGEALAILAGDTLLTGAFEMLSSGDLPHPAVADCVRILARAAGGAGMVGGQVLDLQAERGPFPGVTDSGAAAASSVPASAASSGPSLSPADLLPADSFDEALRADVERLIRIHSMKTGALIAAALEMGAVVAQADSHQRRCLRHYGECCGLAFQIADDLLDVSGSGPRLGKQPGRDRELGKLTCPDLLGMETGRRWAGELVKQACDCLTGFGERAVALRHLARFIVERDH